MGFSCNFSLKPINGVFFSGGLPDVASLCNHCLAAKDSGGKISERPTNGGWIEIPEAFLVGGLDHFLFFHILGIIIPIDYMIFLEWDLKPPTRFDCY